MKLCSYLGGNLMKQSSEFLREELIFTNIKVKNKDEAIRKMAESLYKKGFVKESYINAVLEREKIFPTGLPTEGVGVAIPHTDAIHVNRGIMSIGILQNPISFKIMGNPENNVDVSIIFMMALEEPESQIEMLQKLMKLLQDKDLLLKVKQLQNPKEIKKVFSDF